MSTVVPLRLVQIETDGRRNQYVTVELEAGSGKVLDWFKMHGTSLTSLGPVDMSSLLMEFAELTPIILQGIEKAKAEGIEKYTLSPGEYTLKAPVTNPQKVICIGMNYVDHCAEQNIPVPVEPIIFSKFASAITDPNGPVIMPDETKCLDYEVELAFVICKEGKNIKESEAMSYVAGYTVAHDVSARDWQLHKNGGQWLIGKSFDTFCPIGPALVTRAALSDPHKLGIRCRVNGEIVQESNTDQLVFKTEALVAYISRFMTLFPGDVVLTGTPPGVGCFKKPPCWLKKGDVVECEIDEIGKITNVIQ